MRRIFIIAATTVLTAGAVGANEPALDPNALWTIVHDFCVPNEQQYGNPAPCAAVDLTQGVERGYAVIKDPFGPTRYLLVPTRRITGIEDAALLAPDAVNYFASAWNARSFVDKAVGRELPDDVLSLAVNSPLARSQNQLHIHIDCIRADVRSALERDRAKISERWSLLNTPLDTPLGYHRFQAIRVMAHARRAQPVQAAGRRCSGRACQYGPAHASSGRHELCGRTGWLRHPC